MNRIVTFAVATATLPILVLSGVALPLGSVSAQEWTPHPEQVLDKNSEY